MSLLERLFSRPRKQTYSVPDEEVLATGVRFTVAELRGMADDFWRGKTPPPLSFNENVLLQAMIRADHRRSPEVGESGGET